MRPITKLAAAVAAAFLSLAASSTFAATEAEKRAAIDSGLAYLANTQDASGYFGTGATDYRIANTGSALLALLEEKQNWGANTAAYQTIVDKGLNYLMGQASVVNISGPPTANPDGDGNGVGVKFYPGGTNNRDTYVTGIVLPAIASSGTPDALVTSGPLASRTDGSGAGGAWTFKDVVQNTIDYFAYGQNPDGGWRYYANYGGSDQSTAQWPVISALYASKMGVSMPGFVSTELAKWTDYIQNDATGAAGYDSPYSPYGEMNETGALLVMQDYLGLSSSDASVAAALAYINTHWKETANNTYDGNFGHPYAMWALYKGLELSLGTDADTSIISNLRPGDCGGDVNNPDHGCNWFEDYAEYLVSTQNSNGSWNGYSSWNAGLATPWFINILAATKIPGGGDDNNVPEPATLSLLAVGLLGALRIRRRHQAV